MQCEVCAKCPNKGKCKVKETKKGNKLQIKQKDLKQAETEARRETEQFKQLARVRNGVETLPSNLRNKYNVDKMPRGKNQGKLFFGFKIMALNVKKMTNYYFDKGNYAKNPIYNACEV